MNNQPVSIPGMLAVALLLLNVIILETVLVNNANWHKALWLTLPLFAVAVYQSKKKKVPAEKTRAESFYTT